MAQDSLLGLGRTGVALEPAAGARRIVLHLADRLAGLVDAAANTETVLVAGRLAFVEVEGDQRRREAVRQIRGNVADGSGLALHVEQREASLRGSVKLEDLRDAEALLERLPHAGREAVATSEPKAVRGLVLRIEAVQQVAAKLADVLKRGALPADDVAPELARREPLAHDQRAASSQHRARSQHTTNAVIHGQAVVQPIALLSVHHAREPQPPLHHVRVAHVDGLGHSRAARREDAKRAVVDGDLATPRIRVARPRGFRSSRRCCAIRRESTPAAARRGAAGPCRAHRRAPRRR